MRVAEWEMDTRLCPKCGNDTEDCRDQSHSWYPQREVCYADMALAWARATYDAAHKELPFHDGLFRSWGKERTERTPYRYDEGVRLWVSRYDLTPDDDFLSKPGPQLDDGRGT